MCGDVQAEVEIKSMFIHYLLCVFTLCYSIIEDICNSCIHIISCFYYFQELYILNNHFVRKRWIHHL
jgi:hypothetical protein